MTPVIATVYESLASAAAAAGPAFGSAFNVATEALAPALALVWSVTEPACASASHAIRGVEEAFGPGVATPSLWFATTLVVAVLVWACLRSSSAAKSFGDDAGNHALRAQQVMAPPKEKKPKVPKVRMCRFCEVEVLRAHEAKHLEGKRHRKLAGEHPPSSCWVFVTKEKVAPPSEPPSAPAATVVDAMDDSGGEWETVSTAARKREARALAAAQKKAAKGAPAPAAEELPPRPLRVHSRCNECGVRTRDGATIETDPDDERKAYCTACWSAYLNPQAAVEPEPQAEVRKHVTPWNR